MLSVHCPNCGGTNIFDETKSVPTYCGFCGTHLPDMTNFVQDSLKLGLDKQHHAMEMETIDRQIEQRKTVDKNRLIEAIVILAAIGILVLMFIKNHVL